MKQQWHRQFSSPFSFDDNDFTAVDDASFYSLAALLTSGSSPAAAADYYRRWCSRDVDLRTAHFTSAMIFIRHSVQNRVGTVAVSAPATCRRSCSACDLNSGDRCRVTRPPSIGRRANERSDSRLITRYDRARARTHSCASVGREKSHSTCHTTASSASLLGLQRTQKVYTSKFIRLCQREECYICLSKDEKKLNYKA